MTLPFDLDALKNRPAMLVPTVTYDTVCAFILGINSVTRGSFLTGFQEWVVLELGYGSGLFWTELILRLAFPESDRPRTELSENEGQAEALRVLFESLETFVAESSDSMKLRFLFLRYQRWLEAQEWYDESSPEYFRG